MNRVELQRLVQACREASKAMEHVRQVGVNRIPKQQGSTSSFPNLLIDKLREQQELSRFIVSKAKDNGKINEALRAYTFPRLNG